MWFGWAAWDWAHDRTVRVGGHGAPIEGEDLAWPTEEATRPTRALSTGEDERKTRAERYIVTFLSTGETHTYSPTTETAYAGFRIGDKRKITVSPARGVELVSEQP